MAADDILNDSGTDHLKNMTFIIQFGSFIVRDSLAAKVHFSFQRQVSILYIYNFF